MMLNEFEDLFEEVEDLEEEQDDMMDSKDLDTNDMKDVQDNKDIDASSVMDIISSPIYQEGIDIIAEVLSEAGVVELFDDNNITSDTYYTEAYSTNKSIAGTRINTKEAAFNQAQAMIAMNAAKAANSADYKQLKKINKQRRMLIDRIKKKYKAMSTKEAKKALRKAVKISSFKKKVGPNKMSKSVPQKAVK